MSREKVLQIQGQRPRICNVFDIHFSWPQYPGKIQNYTRKFFLTIGQNNYGKKYQSLQSILYESIDIE